MSESTALPAEEAVSDQELAVLFPAPGVVELASGRVDIMPITFAELPAMLAACKPIEAHLMRFNFMGAVVENPEAARAFVKTGARLDDAMLDSLALPEIAAVANGIVAANPDFFAQRLAGALGMDLHQDTAEALAGLMLSPDSSEPTTPAPTSTA